MSCCDESTARVSRFDLSRRSVLKGMVVVASVISAVRPISSDAQDKRIKLAYCSQLLCGVPYEVARTGPLQDARSRRPVRLYPRRHAAMQALVGGAVDYAATSLDVAIQAYANVGADIRRFAVTGRLPCSLS